MRISELAERWVDERASSHDLKRADVLRAMLGVAAHHPSEVDARLKALVKAQADVSRETKRS